MLKQGLPKFSRLALQLSVSQVVFELLILLPQLGYMDHSGSTAPVLWANDVVPALGAIVISQIRRREKNEGPSTFADPVSH